MPICDGKGVGMNTYTLSTEDVSKLMDWARKYSYSISFRSHFKQKLKWWGHG